MSAGLIAFAGVIAGGLLAYLVIALLRAEDFS
ncbi:K(+)-transporting ATPase subunit F [Derxia gummosa]|uniref:K(+)-transporting ATPase subunit F n=1 Tax=Derxia gummosa DSM 723 TaxID=1121388 RepID=A0A8B6XBI5_9BURK|nr:K(+)-transporting ATPase subunit F [Derxia gummosa]